MRGRRPVDVPAWRRVLTHPATVVAAAVAVLVETLWLLGRGDLPLVGAYFGPLLVGAACLGVMLLRHPEGRRQGLAGEQALRHLRGVVALLERERATPAGERGTGLGDAALDGALEPAGLALQRFAWGDYVGAVPHLEALVAAGRGWPPGPLTGPLDDLAEVTDRLRAVGAGDTGARAGDDAARP